jgi:short-subunit dehydrogenase
MGVVMRGERVLLTGASGRIGADVAMRLAEDGAKLALTARREERLSELADAVEAAGHARPAVLVADLGRQGQAAELGARALEALGGVDVLINNAGACLQGLGWVVGDRDAAREVFETNLWSPLALVAVLVPPMIERGAGVVVNVGSMARVSPFPHLGHYAGSRAAIAAATQTLGLELRPRGVRVVEVALGPVDTPASRENRALVGADAWLDGRPGLADPARAAEAIVAAVQSDVRGVVHFPRSLRWVDRLPGLGRRYSRRVARGADVTDATVRLGGSSGAEELRRLRGDSHA